MPNVPSLTVPMVDEDRTVATAWADFLSSLGGAANQMGPVMLVGSGMPLAARADGSFHIAGGTVSAVSITRGRNPSVTLATGVTAGFVPVSEGDVMSITYTVVPVVTFVPR
jgi:hypothetical protein